MTDRDLQREAVEADYAVREAKAQLDAARRRVDAISAMRAKRTIAATASVFGVSVDGILGPRRTAELAEARAVAIWILRHELALTYPALGRMFNRHHTTAISAVQRIDKRLDDHAVSMAALIDSIRRAANERHV